MQLGNFSISLNVRDIAASRAFYETLGFAVVAGDQDQGWLIMKNGEANIGLFQGILEKNTLTFNPGWDNSGNNLQNFTDIREIEKSLRESGIEVTQQTGDSSGPASFVIVDPDGNPVLLDQHVDSPG
jgi:catechol 2,3-dioxygenase-like lactoylglutathione lyase family enzyme